jgi:hypothetical protein
LPFIADRQPFWLGWRFRFCQGDNQSLVQTFVSFRAFLCGRDLGLFGDVGVQKKTKVDLLSLQGEPCFEVNDFMSNLFSNKSVKSKRSTRL